LEVTAINEAASVPMEPTEEPEPYHRGSEAGVDDSDLLTVTVHANTGQVVKIESMGGPGAHELSVEEMTNLVKDNGAVTLEALLEQAFEAGIACMLGDGAGEEQDARETEEEADLRHLLLKPLLRSSNNRACREIAGPSNSVDGPYVVHEQ
jgi:hypothetical protein